MTENTASFSLYHPQQMKVYFTVAADFDAIDALFTKALAQGYTVTLAGAEPGDTVEDVGYVCRSQKADDTDVIDLYSPNDMLAHRVFRHYLDTPEMIAEFEQSTGLKLNDLPIWIAKAPIDKNDKNWRSYGVAVRKPARIALKDNPKHDPNETEVSKKKPRYLFSRWLPTAENVTPFLAPPSASTPPSTGTGDASPKTVIVTSATDAGAKYDEMFPPSEVNAVTPDALYAKTSALFNAKAHFENWWNEHKSVVGRYTVEEAVSYALYDHWYRDKEEVKQFFEFGKAVLNTDNRGLAMTNDHVMLALSQVNSKPMTKVSEWTGGHLGLAKAAIWAYHAGYGSEALGSFHLDEQMTLMALSWCEKYWEIHKESA